MRLFLVIITVLFFYSSSSVASESVNNQKDQLNMPLALTISIIPGFGSGNYYAHNYSKGLTFTIIDASLVGISIWAYTETRITDYSFISLGVIPTVLLILKIIQAKTVYDDIEAYNSRYGFSRP